MKAWKATFRLLCVILAFEYDLMLWRRLEKRVQAQ